MLEMMGLGLTCYGPECNTKKLYFSILNAVSVYVLPRRRVLSFFVLQ
jgi:hypothetical protein